MSDRLTRDEIERIRAVFRCLSVDDDQKYRMEKLCNMALDSLSYVPKSDAPQRACTLTLKIGADSREYLERAVEEFSRTFDHRVPPGGACGGYDYGWSYEMVIGDRPTHAEYAEALEAYLERERESRISNSISTEKP